MYFYHSFNFRISKTFVKYTNFFTYRKYLEKPEVGGRQLHLYFRLRQSLSQTAVIKVKSEKLRVRN